MRKFKVVSEIETAKVAECQFNDFKKDKSAILEFLMLVMEINESTAEIVYTMFKVCNDPAFVKDYRIDISDNIISIYQNVKTPYIKEIKEK